MGNLWASRFRKKNGEAFFKRGINVFRQAVAFEVLEQLGPAHLGNIVEQS